MAPTTPIDPVRLPGSIQIAFVDPPYAMMQDADQRVKVLAMVEQMVPIMEQGGVVMVRTPVEVTCVKQQDHRHGDERR